MYSSNTCFIFKKKNDEIKRCFHFLLYLGESQDRPVSLYYTFLHLITNGWLKFNSSCFCPCLGTEAHLNIQTNKDAGAGISISIPGFGEEMRDCGQRRAAEIHQGGPLINDTDKYGDVNVKGQAWHQAHGAPLRPRRGGGGGSRVMVSTSCSKEGPAGWRPAKCHISLAGACRRCAPTRQPHEAAGCRHIASPL